MTEYKPSLEYIAGFVDGEGTITIRKYRTRNSIRGYSYNLYFAVSNTNPEVLKAMRDVVGAGCVTRSNKFKNKPHWKECFHWKAHSRKAAIIIEKLLPYLIIKKPQAQLALKFQQKMIQGHHHLTEEEWAFRDKCYREMRKLNGKGR